MYPENFKAESTKRTPGIILEPGRIFIMGRSIPENPTEFYHPVYEWIAGFVKLNSQKTKIDLGFEYINTSSTKWLFMILKELNEMKNLGEYANVTWYYEQGDDDMSELGFILRSYVDCPFLLVEVSQLNKERYDKILTASL
jgi:hypothetical protein